MRRGVIVGATLVFVYSDDEVEALEELQQLISTNTVESCRKAMKGLNIVMQRRHVVLAKEVDRLLAEVIRSGECTDL